MNSEKSGANIFRFMSGLNLHGAGFEAKIQRYSGKEFSNRKGLRLHQLLHLTEEVSCHQLFPI